MKTVVIISFLFLTAMFPFAQDLDLDSLKTALKTEEVDSVKYKLYNAIVIELEKVDRVEATAYAKEKLNIAHGLKDAKKIASSAAAVGSNYLFTGNTDSASSYLLIAKEGYEELGDLWRLNENVNNLALLYQRTNRYEDAIVQYQSSITYSQRLEDYVGEFFAYANLMSLYMDLDDYDEALEYFDRTEDLFINTKEKDPQAAKDLENYYSGVYLNAGQCYLEADDADLESALLYLNKADSSIILIGDDYAQKYYQGYVRHSQGDAYYSLFAQDSSAESSNLYQALTAYESANLLFNEVQDERGICFSLNSLGKVNINLRQFRKANILVNQALEIAQRIDFREEVRDSYNHLATINGELGSYKAANNYLKKWVAIRDQLQNEERTKFTKFAEVRYETQRKQEASARALLEKEKKQRQQQLIFGGSLLFLMGLAYMLFSRFRYNKQREKAEFEQSVNQAMSKFVPMDFIRAIGRSKITDVELDDQIEKEATVLFTDIRSFTTISEKMTPKENFAFVKEYAERMSPIVSRNGGFISQFLGDGIMAIFQGNPSDSLLACIEMQQDIAIYNEILKNRGLAPIKVGMGMHTGSLIMGIIGDETRRDATLISDTVNTAARIESSTKTLNASILISEASKSKLDEPERFRLEEKGNIQVKGKNIPIRVYQCQEILQTIGEIYS